jgi:DNA-binding NarL/FixJ family response regulator
MRKQLKVLISEPNVMYCSLVKKAFEAVRYQFRVVACASSTIEVINAVSKARPDVAMISVNLQDGHLAGIQILPQIRKISPDTRTLIVLESSDQEIVIEAFKFGADGVFCRNQRFEFLCRAVEAISRGQIWASTAEFRYVLDAFVNSSKRRKVNTTAERRITKSESEVVKLAVEGLINREIAKQLGLTEHTVKNYLYRVFNKLGVSNRVELALYCMSQEDTSYDASTVRPQVVKSFSAGI